MIQLKSQLSIFIIGAQLEIAIREGAEHIDSCPACFCNRRSGGDLINYDAQIAQLDIERRCHGRGAGGLVEPSLSFTSTCNFDVVLAGILNQLFTLMVGGDHQRYPGQSVLSYGMIDVAVYLAKLFCGS
jgi:hypothetical protein